MSFNPEKHLRSFNEIPWEPMFDEFGHRLEGIRGKSGASEIGSDGQEIGGDLLEMQPGSAFPLHVHPGDHILYAISGRGKVFIDGEDRVFVAGSTIYIAGAYPHNVSTFEDDSEPFVILAIGHPQKHVSDHDRMKIVEPNSHTHTHTRTLREPVYE